MRGFVDGTKPREVFYRQMERGLDDGRAESLDRGPEVRRRGGGAARQIYARVREGAVSLFADWQRHSLTLTHYTQHMDVVETPLCLERGEGMGEGRDWTGLGWDEVDGWMDGFGLASLRSGMGRDGNGQ